MDVMSLDIRDIWLQTVEALRDTSHVRTIPVAKCWAMSQCDAGNEYRDNRRLSLEFRSAGNAGCVRQRRRWLRRFDYISSERPAVQLF